MSNILYRPCAGVMLMNADGRIFVGQRRDTAEAAWQMPQGGIDDGENALTAAIRELREETGVTADKVELIAEAPEELCYAFPPALAGRMWKGKWGGQRQRWFLFRFLGDDADIDIATEHPEFSAWKWSDPHDLPLMIVPFKRALYESLLVVFAPYLGARSAAQTPDAAEPR